MDRKTDLSYVLPSRRCISMYPEDAYYLNLEMVTRHFSQKEDIVVTVQLWDLMTSPRLQATSCLMSRVATSQ